YFYAIMLCEQGDLQQAQQVLNEVKKERPRWTRQFDLILLADSKGPARAYKTYQNPRISKSSDMLFLFPALLFLGRGNEARADLRALRRTDKREKPTIFAQTREFEAVLAYLCGDASEAEFLNSTSDSRMAACMAEWLIGMVHLANGDRAKAKEHFQKSIAHYPFYEYNLSRVMLARLKQDPHWPPWIRAKK
ncbi:MAG TPA: tetratricopeptide repeat protein, partial [Gemmataceae bacterium]|nr:tetratricopeptide repeat protein [Gemmataceae bacterium]